jgi:SAM-dependent methyltransferase
VTSTYDRIARFYDVDMAQNMRFDDVAFYAHQCERSRGAVLELGCGNGRILLPLLSRGFDAVGVDASAPMLLEMKRKARAQSLPMRAIRADVRRLPLRGGFSAILCPYSLITYMTTAEDAKALVEGSRALLAPRGLLVIDAFVPRPIQAQAEFQADYRRPFGAFTLARSKRIQASPEGTNRIERRYELIANGRVVDTIEVVETIRPCAPEAVREAVIGAGLAPVTEAWDYGTRPGADGAQFFTVVARARD